MKRLSPTFLGYRKIFSNNSRFEAANLGLFIPSIPDHMNLWNGSVGCNDSKTTASLS